MKFIPLESETDDNIRFYYKFSIYIRVVAALTMAWFGVIAPLSSLEGRGFPEPNELQYSEGILKVYTQKVLKGSDYNVLMLKEMTSNKHTEYYCGYSASHYARANWCFTNEEIEPYKGKHAKIGWYYQDRFLWLKNPHPQLVSLQVDGKEVRSYQDTKDLVRRYKKSSIYWYGAISLLTFTAFGFMYYLGLGFGRHCKKAKQERGIM